MKQNYIFKGSSSTNATKDKIVKIGGPSITLSIIFRFNSYVFTFILISTMFQECQTIQKQKILGISFKRSFKKIPST